MRVLFTCGGTAGHINPALAAAGKLKELMPDTEFLFIGSGREMERKLVPAAGYRLENIEAMGFNRSISLEGLKDNLEMLRCLIESRKQAKKLIRDFKPDLAVGTGGYVCYPVLKAAAAMGIPTALHESNAVPGLTTKLLEGTVQKIMVAFPAAAAEYRHKDKVIVTGTPVRGDFLNMTQESAKAELGYSGKKLVVSMWGSLGASVMNEYMQEFILKNTKEKSFCHIHATGGGEERRSALYTELLKKGMEQKPENLDLRSYIYDMGVVMNAADVVLCRAGASTIAELTALGKPSVLVPSPNVTNNHQEKNAREVERAGGAVVILEPECSGKKLYETVKTLTQDDNKLNEMKKGAASLGKRDSVELIASELLSLVGR